MNKNVVATIGHNEYKDALLTNTCLTHSMKEFKVSTRQQDLMKSTKFHCLVLIMKYTSKTMDTMDQLLVIRVNYKNSHFNNYSEKLFCQANCFNFHFNQNSFFVKHIALIFSLIRTVFLSNILNLKNAKSLKKLRKKN